MHWATERCTVPHRLDGLPHRVSTVCQRSSVAWLSTGTKFSTKPTSLAWSSVACPAARSKCARRLPIDGTADEATEDTFGDDVLALHRRP